jgi:hypothetical protein
VGSSWPRSRSTAAGSPREADHRLLQHDEADHRRNGGVELAPQANNAVDVLLLFERLDAG